MISKQVEINGISFQLTLTDQIINQVDNLKDLYAATYEDPESFGQVSSQISSAINEISSAVEPKASDNDLDGLIQEIIKVVDNKHAEVEKVLGKKSQNATKPTKKRKKTK